MVVLTRELVLENALLTKVDNKEWVPVKYTKWVIWGNDEKGNEKKHKRQLCSTLLN